VLPPPVKAAARAGGLKRKKGEARHDRCCARKGKPKAVKGRGRKSVIAERRSFETVRRQADPQEKPAKPLIHVRGRSQKAGTFSEIASQNIRHCMTSMRLTDAL